MKIDVTAKHIRNGMPLSMCDCPVALAVKQRLRKYVTVDVHDISYAPYNQWLMPRRKSKTPPKVKRFMKKFDTGKMVRPFSFNISFTEIEPRGKYIIPWELK